MANTITREMIEGSTKKGILWLGYPESIAKEIYPECELVHEVTEATIMDRKEMFTDGDRFALGMEWTLRDMMNPKWALPESVASDQVEDWLVAHVFKKLIETGGGPKVVHG